MSAAAGSIHRGRPRGLWAGRIFLGFLVTSLAIGFLTLGALLAQVFLEGYKWVDAVLFFEPPSADPLIAGARPAILATIYLGIIIIALSVPLGVGTAIYLEEYANRDRWYNRMLEVNIQNLAAVPSIVYGILGLAFLVRGIGLGQVLPAAIPGIATGSILALSRGLGETAPLLLVGALTYVSFNPTILGDFTALPVQIYQWIARPQEEFRTLAAAGIIVLLAILLTLNAFAIWLRNKYERRGEPECPSKWLT